jgi:hypothetical protein
LRPWAFAIVLKDGACRAVVGVAIFFPTPAPTGLGQLIILETIFMKIYKKYIRLENLN